jgi:hypothetical protein
MAFEFLFTRPFKSIGSEARIRAGKERAREKRMRGQEGDF